MYMNKNKGRKQLLAAVMALAMIACAVVAFIPSEDSEGIVGVSTYDTNDVIPTNGVILSGSDASYYYIDAETGNVTLTINPAESTGGTINLYVEAGTNLTIKKGTVDGSTAYSDVTVYAAVADTYDAEAKEVDYYDGLTITIANANYTDVGILVSVAASGTAYAGISTSVTVEESPEYGVLVSTANNDVYYAEGSAVSNVNLTYRADSPDSVTVKNGSATVSQGANRVSVNATSGTNTVTAGATYPAISGTGFTVENGIFTSSSVTLANGAEMTVSAAKYYSNQIITTIPGVTSSTEKVTAASVYGNVTQKTQVGSADVMETDGTGIALTLVNEKNAVLTINDNVNVYVDNITPNDGEVVLFGALYSHDAVASLSGKIGPNGYYENITFTATNTNVATGDDYTIYGVPSSPSVGNAILGEGGLEIPEGTTFTVTGNLGLNGKTITVYGTLVIENRASIFGTNDPTNEYIKIMGKGTIQNNGSIGKMLPVKVVYDDEDASTTADPSITMQGVSGVGFNINKDKDMVVSGNVTAATGSKTSVLTVNGAIIGGDFTTAKKVTLTIDGTGLTTLNVSKGSNVVLNGPVVKGTTPSAVAISISEGSSVSVNGSVGTNVSFTAAVGELEDASTVPDGEVTIGTITNTTGFTMYVKKVGIANETTNTTDYYLRAYVNGSLVLVDKTIESGSITVSGDADNSVFVAAGETLNVGEDIAITMSYATFEGTMVVQNGATDSVSSYIGATYGVDSVGENNSTVTTTYYTSLADALEVIGTVNDDGITAVVTDLGFDVTVADGQLIDLTVNGTISQDAVLTVQNGGTLSGTIAKVDGKMVIQVDADSVTPLVYDVMSVSADETVTYAGIVVAIAEAQPGDKITVGSATVGSAASKQSLTIPQGVQVTISEDITVYGDLTIAQGAILIGGTVNMARPDSKVTVNGVLDLSDGSFSGFDNFVLTSAGTTTVSSVDGLSYNGARYVGDDGTVITSVADAVAYAAENQIPSVSIHGTVTATGDLAVNGVDIILDSNAVVTLGSVTLSDAKIDADASRALLTASVSGMNGVGDAAVSGTVSVNKSNTVIDASQIVNAAGTTEYTYSISAVSGTMSVQSGTVVIISEIDTAAGSKFTVAQGATLLVGKNGDLDVQGEKTVFTVDGTLAVDEGAVSFIGGDSVINGTVTISGMGSVDASKLVINGALTVSDTENDEGTFTVNGDNVVVGDVKNALGSTGSIVGIIGFSGADHIVAYAGTDMSGARLADDAEFYTTEFYVNDALYATVYANSAITNDVIDDGDIKAIETIKDDGTVTWKDAAGEAIANISSITIGEVGAVYASAPLVTVNVTVSVGSGISLFIDGVKYVSGETVPLTIGTHTVSATVNPGYTGDVTVTFDGKAVTDSFTVSADMDAPVISAIGQITVDTGSSGSDDGMGLTDYLLIVLVILILVMAIMVAMRLMRS